MAEEHTPAPKPSTNSDGLFIAACLFAALASGVTAFLIAYFSSNQQMVGFTTLLIYATFAFFGVGLLVPLFKNSESPAAAIIVMILYVVIAFGLAMFASSIAGWAIYSNSLG